MYSFYVDVWTSTKTHNTKLLSIAKMTMCTQWYEHTKIDSDRNKIHCSPHTIYSCHCNTKYFAVVRMQTEFRLNRCETISSNPTPMYPKRAVAIAAAAAASWCDSLNELVGVWVSEYVGDSTGGSFTFTYGVKVRSHCARCVMIW